MKKFKKLLDSLPNSNSKIIAGGIIAVFGLTVLLFPSISIKTICYCLGGAAAGAGLVKLVKYLKATKNRTARILDILTAILLLTCSTLLFRPTFAASILPFILGVIIFLGGISSFFSLNKGLLAKVLSIFTMASGLFLMLNPFDSAKAMVSIVGVGIIVFGVVFSVIAFNSKKESKVKIDENGYKEIEFRDVEE